MRMRSACWLLIMSLGVGWLCGCFLPTDRDIAGQMTASIRARYAPVQVQVTVSRPSVLCENLTRLDLTLAGFTAASLPVSLPAPSVARPGMPPAPPSPHARDVLVGVLHLHCDNCTIAGMPLRTVDLTLTHAHLRFPDPAALDCRVVSATSAGGYAVLSEEGLSQFMRARALPLSRPQLRVRGGRCVISGVTRYFPHAAVEISGEIDARPPAVLYLQHPALRVYHLHMPRLVSRRVLREINPLTDLNTALPLPAPVSVTHVAPLTGALRFDFLVHFPQERK